MDIHIHTQCRENYGTAEEPYWKFKGGSTYVVVDVIDAEAAVAAARPTIEYSNPMSEEYILNWELLPADTPTEDEKDQVEFDGKITHPSKRLPLTSFSI